MGKEGGITDAEWHGSEAAGRLGLLDNAQELASVEAHRLLHYEGDTPIKKVVGSLRHRVVPSQREDEVWFHLVQHRRVAGEGGSTTADFEGPVHRYFGLFIVYPDYLDILHRREMAKVCRVVERVPVADADRGNSDGHFSTSPEPGVEPNIPRRITVSMSEHLALELPDDRSWKRLPALDWFATLRIRQSTVRVVGPVMWIERLLSTSKCPSHLTP